MESIDTQVINYHTRPNETDNDTLLMMMVMVTVMVTVTVTVAMTLTMMIMVVVVVVVRVKVSFMLDQNGFFESLETRHLSESSPRPRRWLQSAA